MRRSRIVATLSCLVIGLGACGGSDGGDPSGVGGGDGGTPTLDSAGSGGGGVDASGAGGDDAQAGPEDVAAGTPDTPHAADTMDAGGSGPEDTGPAAPDVEDADDPAGPDAVDASEPDGSAADVSDTVEVVDEECQSPEDCQPGACDVASCVAGECAVVPADDGVECDAGDDLCAAGGQCVAGACEALPIDCDDDDACTTDGCDAATGACVHAAVDGCDCTTDAHCVDLLEPGPCLLATCVLGLCELTPLADGLACTTDALEADACAAGGLCDDGICAAVAVSCDDGQPCTQDACDPEAGCTHEPVAEGTQCLTDAVAAGVCVDGGACLVGQCVGVPVQCPGDGDDCTDDVCDPASGACVYAEIAGCEAPCQTDSECAAVMALGPCDVAVCAAGQCAKTAGADGAPCSSPAIEADACLDGGTCLGGACAGLPVDCDDGEPCTQDWCDPATGCATTPESDGMGCVTGAIEDDPCAVSGICSDGECGPMPVVCDDGNPCTSDTCTPGSGCAASAIADGAACSTASIAADACAQGGQCLSGACSAVPVLCDDGNPCTADACDPASGCVEPPVSDGVPCTTDAVAAAPCAAGGVCAAGACTVKPLVCEDDGNPCTDDLCDPAADACAHPPIAGCELPCQTDDECAGKVTPGPCGAAVCQGGECAVAPAGDGQACTTPSIEADACVADGACQGGACVAAAVVCDDGNPCTTDGCDPASGCTAAAVVGAMSCSTAAIAAAACVDGGQCVAGQCEAIAVECADDGDPCTKDFCDLGQDACVHPAISGCVPPCASDLDCASEPAGPCEQAVCQAGTCVVAPLANDTACTSGAIAADACASGGTCVAGACAPVAIECDDGNPCTTDGCDPATGCTTINKAKGTSCTTPAITADACALGGTCQSGTCVAVPQLCDDGNPCTIDECDPASGCTASNVGAGAPCSTPAVEQAACTDGGVCQGGACVGIPVECADDGKVCTDDLCDPAADACAHPPKPGCVEPTCEADGDCAGQVDPGPCGVAVCVAGQCQISAIADDTPCTSAAIAANACADEGRCQAGTCAPVAIECDDGNPCTLDGCDPAAGCTTTNLAKGTACSTAAIAGDACAAGGTCQAGTCTGTPVVCDDDNPCTTDGCDPGSGCTATPVAPGVACATAAIAADACAIGGTCQAGVCSPVPLVCDDLNPCTADGCDPAIGCTASNVAKGAPCTTDAIEASACAAGGTCQAGQCAATPVVCNDLNPCTADGCDPATGCTSTPVAKGTPCATAAIDADQCAAGGSCQAGQCAPIPLPCEDGNPCSVDGCAPGVGCQSTAASDGLPCTTPAIAADACAVGGTCQAGQCAPVPVGCDDGDGCTADACDAMSGDCMHEPIIPCGDTCDDDAYCASIMTAGPCTEPTCVAQTCQASPLADGTACTTAAIDDDLCALGGACQGGVCAAKPKPCDPGVACAIGLCLAATGECEYGVAADCTCTADGECDPAEYCLDTGDVGVCEPDLPLGAPCDGAPVCASILCAQTDLSDGPVCVACLEDAGCDQGGCLHGRCLGDGECLLAADCPGGMACGPGEGAVGTCVPMSLLGEPCEDSALCATDLCADPGPAGYCVECVGDEDCGAGELCVDGGCQPADAAPCSLDAECAGGEYCAMNLLSGTSWCATQKGPGGACTADTACQSLICDLGSEQCLGCLGDADCAGDAVCVDGACDLVDDVWGGCASDAECALGEWCQKKKSAANVCLPERDLGEPCSKDLACASGHCDGEPEAKVCVECEADEHCPAAETCFAGTCALDDIVCEIHQECGPSGWCSEGVCKAEKGKAAPCGGNYECKSGHCAAVAGASICVACSADGHCAGSGICVDFECKYSGDTTECAVDSDCPAGEWCELNPAGANACASPSPIGSPCTANAYCESGLCATLLGSGGGTQCVECKADADCGEGAKCKLLAKTCDQLTCEHDEDACDPGEWCDKKPEQTDTCEPKGALGESCPKKGACQSGHCADTGAGKVCVGCEELADCAAGELCADFVCEVATPCSANEDCAAGEFCNKSIGSLCLPTFALDAACTKNSACTSGRCVGEPGAKACVECVEHEDCGGGEFCGSGASSNACVPKKDLGEPCSGDVKCASGTCDAAGSGNCVACLLDSQCADDEICDATTCIPASGVSLGDPCAGNDQCKSSLCAVALDAPVCVKCKNDGHCVATRFCDKSEVPYTCEPKGGHGDPCADEGECLSGFCGEGACVDCLGDADCGAKAYCANAEGQVCLPLIEAGDPCKKNSACESGDCTDLGAGKVCVECVGDGDCPAASEHCEGGVCLTKGGAGVTCGADSQCLFPSCNASGLCDACGGDSDCATDAWCDASLDYTRCLPKGDVGDACGASAECASGVCLLVIGECVECTSHDHCPSDEWCSTAKCVPGAPNGESCLSDGDCQSGHCKKAPGAPFGFGVCNECLADAHCDAGAHEVCKVTGDVGTCKVAVDYGAPCWSDSDCWAGSCDDGHCSDDGNPCGADADCGSGHCNLVADVCQACVATADCPAGQWCKHDAETVGYCLDTKGGGEPCEDGTECDTGACNPNALLGYGFCAWCTADLQCDADEFCNDSQWYWSCQTLGWFGASCSADEPCNPALGLYCGSKGQCIECSTDAGCPGADVCYNSKCVPPVSLGGTCSEHSDCASGHCWGLTASEKDGTCVECWTDNHCPGTEYCSNDGLVCKPKIATGSSAVCLSNNHCMSGHCDKEGLDPNKWRCVECADDGDCADGDTYCETSGINDCVDHKGLFESCSGHNECTTGYCQPLLWQCLPEP